MKTTKEQIDDIAIKGNTQKFHIDSLIQMDKQKWFSVSDVEQLQKELLSKFSKSISQTAYVIDIDDFELIFNKLISQSVKAIADVSNPDMQIEIDPKKSAKSGQDTFNNFKVNK